jgi:hypothetical protein
MIEDETCEECTVMEAVTTVDCMNVCYRCANKLRQKARVRKEKYKREEEEIHEF